MSPQLDRPILIAGGGPVGVIGALALAHQGLPVHVFEAAERVNDAPRAATLHAATLEMLAKLALIDDVVEQGLIAPLFRIWDRPSGEMTAEFDFGLLKNDTPYPFAVQCEQHKLANMTIARLRTFPSVKIDFCSEVTELKQLDDRVEIIAKVGGASHRFVGSYLIGADGGRSTVRKTLGIEFEGYTHPERFLVLTTAFDFTHHVAGCFRNYFSDPEEWCALFKVTGDDRRGLWRVLFPTHPDETDAAAFDDEKVQQRLHRFFKKSDRYPVIHRNIYRVHQRVAASFRRGRAFLAGDAAHVNNPLGGLGLNFGIHDVIELADLLGRVARREATEDALDLYDDRRRSLNIEYVQQQTIDNKKRLEEKDPTARANRDAALRALAANPATHRAYLLRASLLESVRRARVD
jgi:3-(3-hydroxy-phenyl)propionate hydroxylase